MIRPWPSVFREYLDRIPTTDLYFLNPLAELRRQGARFPPLRCLAPNIYLAGGAGVIVRYGNAADVDRLRHAGAKRLVYVVDDDFAAGAADKSVPERYRAKLAAFAERDWPGLVSAADVIVVPGVVLADLHGPKARIIAPAWHHLPASSRHFSQKTVEIVHLGTGSHRGDLAPLAAPFARVLSAHPNARLTLFAGDAAPEALKSHPQVRSRKPLSWWRYKRALPKMRFHLALYPLADTAFNRARSANKLFEHAIVGAASLMSPNPALREAAGDALAGVFVEGGVDEWTSRIEAVLSEPQALRESVDATRAHILAENPLSRAAAAWREILAPEL